MEGYDPSFSLLCRARGKLCALPLGQVLETMRTLPIEPVSGAPHFVLGLSIIRGEPLPVIDLARFFDEETSEPARLITIAIDNRRVALAVDAVLGVRAISPESLQALPPLLQDTAALSALGTLDSELLMVLHAGRLLPEDLWASLEGPPA